MYAIECFNKMKALEEKNIMEFEVNIPKLNKIFKQLDSIKIAIIGDLMIDRYFHGTMDRISPEAPVPILSLTKTVRKLWCRQCNKYY